LKIKEWGYLEKTKKKAGKVSMAPNLVGRDDQGNHLTHGECVSVRKMSRGGIYKGIRELWVNTRRERKQIAPNNLKE